MIYRWNICFGRELCCVMEISSKGKSSRESTSSLQAKIVDSNCISFGFSFGFRICTPAWALYGHAAYRWKVLDLTKIVSAVRRTYLSRTREGSLLKTDTDEKCYRKTDRHRFPIIGWDGIR